jgi:hypothetical protein
MALSVKASFTAISIPLSTPPRWFKLTEGKNTLSLKNSFYFNHRSALPLGSSKNDKLIIIVQRG